MHADSLSSAPVYIRRQSIDEEVPPSVLCDAGQLVKDNSIVGRKLPQIKVVYTPWSNLKKTGDMDVGQVSRFCRSQTSSCQISSTRLIFCR